VGGKQERGLTEGKKNEGKEIKYRRIEAKGRGGTSSKEKGMEVKRREREMRLLER
jgi:hypothetical protein